MTIKKDFEDTIIDYEDTNPEKTLGDLQKSKKKYKRKVSEDYIECGT